MIDRVPAIDAQPFLEGALPGAVDKGMEVRPVPSSESGGCFRGGREESFRFRFLADASRLDDVKFFVTCRGRRAAF